MKTRDKWFGIAAIIAGMVAILLGGLSALVITNAETSTQSGELSELDCVDLFADLENLQGLKLTALRAQEIQVLETQLLGCSNVEYDDSRFAITDVLIPLAVFFAVAFVGLGLTFFARRLSPEARSEALKKARVFLILAAIAGVIVALGLIQAQNPWFVPTAILILLGLAVIALVIYIADRVGRAARRKGRSYAAFFWLSLLWSPLITGLVVAALPFLPNDPIHLRDDVKRARK